MLLENAFVLHRRDYRETSLLVDLFIEHFGRICVIAKGAKRRKSPFQFILEPFIRLSVAWRGKGELPILQIAEVQDTSCYFKGLKLLSGLYVNELLMMLLHRHNPNERIFHYYDKLLNDLQHIADNDSVSLERSLRKFEKSFIAALGFGLDFHKEANTNRPICANNFYVFSKAQGFVVAKTIDQTQLFLGKDLLAIAADDYTSCQVLKTAKRLMRYVLSALLEGKTLKSRLLHVETDCVRSI